MSTYQEFKKTPDGWAEEYPTVEMASIKDKEQYLTKLLVGTEIMLNNAFVTQPNVTNQLIHNKFEQSLHFCLAILGNIKSQTRMPLFTLPTQYRPKKETVFAGSAAMVKKPIELHVMPDGLTYLFCQGDNSASDWIFLNGTIYL